MLTSIALMLAACITASATAQTGNVLTKPYLWTSADGGLHFAIPAGWTREGLKTGSKEIELAVSKGDKASGLPVLHCKLAIKLLGTAPPDLTQAALNARMQAGAKSITLDEKRLTTKGGITFIDGFLSMTPRILIEMKTFYVRAGVLFDANMECLRTPDPMLTMGDLKIARELFDTVSVTP